MDLLEVDVADLLAVLAAVVSVADSEPLVRALEVPLAHSCLCLM